MKKITAGKINQSLLFNLANKVATDITEYKLGYIRYNEGDGTSYTETVTALTALATIATAHTDNKAIFFADVTSGNMLHIRVDFPDATFATGKDFVICNVYDDGNNVVGSWEIDLRPDLSGYKDGYVYVDTGASNTNTILGEDGTETKPVSTITAGKTLADQLFKKLEIVGLFSSVADTLSNYHIRSREGLAELNGNDVNLSSARLSGVHVSGDVICDSDTTIENGVIDTLLVGVASGLNGHVTNCRVEGDNGVKTGANLRINKCYGTLPDTEVSASFSFNGASGRVSIHGFKGTLNIKDMNNASHKLEAYDVSKLELESSCTLGTVELNEVDKLIKDKTVNTQTINIQDAERFYPDGKVYFDADVVNDSVLFGHDGTKDNPVSNQENWTTLLALMGKDGVIRSNTNITYQMPKHHITAWDGSAHLQGVAGGAGGGSYYGGSIITECKLSGPFSGDSTTILKRCLLDNITGAGIQGSFYDCSFSDNINLSDAGNANSRIHNMYSRETEGDATPVLNYQAGSTFAHRVYIHNLFGNVIVDNMTHANDVLEIYGHKGGTITLNASCTLGTVNIYTDRPSRVTDNSGGATVNIYPTDVEDKLDIVDSNVDDIRSLSITMSTEQLVDIENKIDVIDANIDAIQGATFDTATDSLEAIRDRGDVAWISGMGGATDYSKYYNGCIYYDESAGNVNTVLGTDGTPDNPVSSWSAFKTLAIALGTRKGIIKGNMNIDSACKTFELIAGPLGSNSGATEVSQIYITSSFEGVTVRNLDVSSLGLTTGIAYLNRMYDCLLFLAGTAISGELIRCLFIGNTSYNVINYSTIHGGGVTNTWENITFNFVNASSSLGVKDFKCTNILLTGMVAGNEAFIEGHKGVITIDAGCTGGTLKAVGDYKVIDNSGGAVTVVTSNNGLLAWNGNEVTGDGDWALLKSVVDAIKIVTDKMVFTVANILDVNVKAIEDDTDSADRLSKAIKATEVGIVGTGGHTLTSIASSDLTTLSLDALTYGVINFTSGVNKGRSAPILTLDASGGMTFNPSFPLISAPSQGDTFTAT